MSTIDLERLIVKQTYFIPIEAPKLKNAILQELRASERALYHIYPWNLSEEHKESFAFSYSIEYCFVYTQTMGKRTSKLVALKSKEYGEGLPETLHKKVKKLMGHFADDIHVFITRKEKEGCIVEVECLPLLYRQICQYGMKANELDLQNAYLRCKRFVKTIFEGGLSATLITEKKKEVARPKVEFLINDTSTRQITEKIEAMFTEVTGQILIIGWMGTILLKKLREIKEKGVEVKVITGNVKTIRQDPMRKEKERAMKELIDIIGKENISIKPEFHGRAIVVDNKALVGSIDLDSYSLTGTRIEFATYTEDPEIVRTLRKYFKGIFSPLKKTE